MADAGAEYPLLPAGSSSLLKTYLTPAVWLALKDRRTASGVSLHQCIRSGLANPDSVIGLYAGDADSYEVFGALFTPIIAACHARPRIAESSGALDNPDPEGRYIVSARVRLARNLAGHPLRLMATPESDRAVERAAERTFAAFSGALAGAYRPATDTTARHTFGRDDRFQEAAGLNRNWPDARGVFANADQTFFVWVNEEDHLRFISAAPGADMAGAYDRLRDGLDAAANGLAFQRNDRLGAITSCPTNLGPALRAGFRVTLPCTGGTAAFDAICRRHHLTVRAIAGEGAPTLGRTFDISRRGRLDESERACLVAIIAGVREVIALKKSAH